MDSRATIFTIAFASLISLLLYLYYTNSLPTLPSSNESFGLDADDVTAASVGAYDDDELVDDSDSDDDNEML